MPEFLRIHFFVVGAILCIASFLIDSFLEPAQVLANKESHVQKQKL